MYHFQGVTLSFTRRNSIIYEAQVANLRMPRHKTPSLNREGWGGSPVGLGRGLLLTLHLNSLSSNKLHRTVKFIYLLQHLYNTTSAHPEMYHHSLLRTFIAQIIWPFGNMFVLLSATTHWTRIYGATAWNKLSAAESLLGLSKNERGTRSREYACSSRFLLLTLPNEYQIALTKRLWIH